MMRNGKGRGASLQLSVMGVLVFCLLAWTAIGMVVVRAFEAQ
jgi:hypothetical protein